MESKPPAKRKKSSVVPSVKIFPERNLEKWSIWVPAKARGPVRARIFERNVTIGEGKKVLAKLTVGFTQDGTLTTDEQRVYYGLVKLWEKKGRKEMTPFSLYELASVLGIAWGSQERAYLRRALIRLKSIPLIWESSYLDAIEDEHLDLLHPFTVLDDLRLARRKKKETVTDLGYFRFHDAILNNLLSSFTKPLLFDVVISFRNDIAQLLYTRLDLILSDKTYYERKTKELFEDLGLEGKAYVNLSNRLQRLRPAIKELQGKPITSGVLSSVTLEPTKDGGDYKLVVRKGKAVKVIEVPSTNVVHFPVPTPDKPTEAETLVQYFHYKFHGTVETHINRKALDQAVALIARRGVFKARYVIEYAAIEAVKTKFKPNAFGAILCYEVRAIKEYDKNQQEELKKEETRKLRTAKEEERKKKEEEEQKLLASQNAAFDEFWTTLSPDEQVTFKDDAFVQAASEESELRPWFTGFHMYGEKSKAKEVCLKNILMAHFKQSRLV